MDNYIKAQEAYYQASEGINVKKNERIVLQNKIPIFCCFFAYSIPGANIEEHFKIVFNSEDKYWLDWFIKLINYKGTKVEKWLMYI